MHEAQFLCWPRCWLAILRVRAPIWKYGWKTKAFVQNQKYLRLNWLKGYKMLCCLAFFPQIISPRKAVQIMLPGQNERRAAAAQFMRLKLCHWGAFEILLPTTVLSSQINHYTNSPQVWTFLMLKFTWHGMAGFWRSPPRTTLWSQARR